MHQQEWLRGETEKGEAPARVRSGGSRKEQVRATAFQGSRLLGPGLSLQCELMLTVGICLEPYLQGAWSLALWGGGGVGQLPQILNLYLLKLAMNLADPQIFLRLLMHVAENFVDILFFL